MRIHPGILKIVIVGVFASAERQALVGKGLKGLLFACMSLLFVAYEQTIDADLPYERLIVINTFVGRTTDSLAWISRTLPALEEPTFENAAILDADVKMYWGDTVYQLSSNAAKRGYTLPEADARWQGDSLRMVVEWQGLRAESVARMPVAPTVVGVAYDTIPGSDRFRTPLITLRTRPGVVVWIESESRFYNDRPAPPLAMYEYYRVVPGNPSDPEQEVAIRANEYYVIVPGDTVRFKISVADAAYARYLDEPQRGGDGPFSFGGAKIYSNVGGQGIGMFVPVASVQSSIVVE